MVCRSEMLCEKCQLMCHVTLYPRPPPQGWCMTAAKASQTWVSLECVHHRNADDLEHSAEKGCLMCFKTLEAISPPDLKFLKNSKSSIFYTVEKPNRGLPPSYNVSFFFYEESNDLAKENLTKTVAKLTFNSSRSGWGVHKTEDRQVEASTSSTSTITLASEWLQECVRNHPDCNRTLVTSDSADSASHPSRLLSLSPKDTPLSIRVCEGPEIPANANYMTLSHCWGSLPILTLTTKNIEQLRNSIPHGQLCKTFQDAVDITRKLGVEYLWIDSLCIIQDSDDDWERESALMGQIYSKGFCNIAATKALDGRYGCYSERDPRTIMPCHIVTSWNSNLETDISEWDDETRNYSPWYSFDFQRRSTLEHREKNHEFVYLKDEYRHSFKDEPLNQRGWVVQEVLLAPRNLHFSHSLLWECNEGWKSEGSPDGTATLGWSSPRITKAVIGGRDPFQDKHCDSPSFQILHRSWQDVVAKYSRCALSYETDTLPALSGIAKVYQAALNDEYLAGLWRKDLENQLLWRTSSPGVRTKNYIAPSWSWASLKSYTIDLDQRTSREMGYRRLDPVTLMVNILSTNITLKGDDPTGSVVDGSLVIKCRLTQVYEKFETSFHLFCNREIPSWRILVHVQLDVPRNSQTGFSPNKRKLVCLPLRMKWNNHADSTTATKYVDKGMVEGLILEEQNSEKLEFRRCGSFSKEAGSSDESAIRDFWGSFDDFDASHESAALRPEYVGEDETVVQYNAEIGACEMKRHMKRYIITIK